MIKWLMFYDTVILFITAIDGYSRLVTYLQTIGLILYTSCLLKLVGSIMFPLDCVVTLEEKMWMLLSG